MRLMLLNNFCYILLAFLVFFSSCRQNVGTHRALKRRQSQAYALKLISPVDFKPGNNVPLKLQVIDIKTRKPLKDFIRDQGELAHITIVNQQFNHFQHVHPKVKNGNIEASIKVREDGGNIAYLRFSAIPGKREILKTYFYVEDRDRFNFNLPIFNPLEATAGPYKFQLEPVYSKLHQPTLFTVNVMKDNKPASTESIKGFAAHGVLINQSEWTLIPLDSLPSMSYYQQGKRYFKAPFSFVATIEESGDYSLWLQFKINGKIEPVRFTFPICREMPCVVDY